MASGCSSSRSSSGSPSSRPATPTARAETRSSSDACSRPTATGSRSRPSSATSSTPAARCTPRASDRSAGTARSFARRWRRACAACGTDHVDLYQLHNPRRDAVDARRVLRHPRGPARGGQDPRLRGRARARRSAGSTRDLRAISTREIASVQTVYNLLEQDPGRELMAAAADRGVGLIARVPDLVRAARRQPRRPRPPSGPATTAATARANGWSRASRRSSASASSASRAPDARWLRRRCASSSPSRR